MRGQSRERCRKTVAVCVTGARTEILIDFLPPLLYGATVGSVHAPWHCMHCLNRPQMTSSQWSHHVGCESSASANVCPWKRPKVSAVITNNLEGAKHQRQTRRAQGERSTTTTTSRTEDQRQTGDEVHGADGQRDNLRVSDQIQGQRHRGRVESQKESQRKSNDRTRMASCKGQCSWPAGRSTKAK